jgi:hypothetical protein
MPKPEPEELQKVIEAEHVGIRKKISDSQKRRYRKGELSRTPTAPQRLSEGNIASGGTSDVKADAASDRGRTE